MLETNRNKNSNDSNVNSSNYPYENQVLNICNVHVGDIFTIERYG